MGRDDPMSSRRKPNFIELTDDRKEQAARPLLPMAVGEQKTDVLDVNTHGIYSFGDVDGKTAKTINHFNGHKAPQVMNHPG